MCPPYALVFGGGTALARAHRLVQRMSEDVDFKIVPLPEAPTSRNGQRRALGDLTDKVTASLQAAGFAFDPTDPARTRSRNENRYTIWQLPYAPPGQGLRPTIQIELTYAPMRCPTVARAVSSFVAEAFNRPPEVPSIPCVSITETTAEKLVALTRRIAMGTGRPQPRPRPGADPARVRPAHDARPRGLRRGGRARPRHRGNGRGCVRNQHPAYAADIADETRKALDALGAAPEYRPHYNCFVADMAYGEKPACATAMRTVSDLAESAWDIRRDGE